MNMEEGKRRLAVVTIIVIIAALAAFWFLYQEDERLDLYFFNIGQGDSELIETINGKTILIDGGPPDKAVLRELSKALPFWQRRIDLIIVTHAHDDHFGGLSSVVERYNVGAVMLSDIDSTGAAYDEFLDRIKEKNIPVIRPSRTDMNLDGVVLHILAPTKSLAQQKISNPNNASIVVRVSYGALDILYTGDAEHEEEKELLTTVKNELPSEIIKLGHHGSDTSSGDDFLAAVKPELAIASAGVNNSYGHPSPRILRRLERLDIKIFRTDQNGTLHFKSDGNSVFNGSSCIIGCSSL
jgi:competence protein ComEC